MNRSLNEATSGKSWKDGIREELYGFLDAAGANRQEALAAVYSEYDELLLHGQYACANDLVDKALRSFKECARLRPDEFLPRCALGRILMGQGFYGKAEKHIRKAAELNPNDFKTKVTWLYLLRKTGTDPVQAVRLQGQIDDFVVATARRLGYADQLDLRMLHFDTADAFWLQSWSEQHVTAFKENRYTVLHNVLPDAFRHLLLLSQRAALNAGVMRAQVQWQRRAVNDLPLATIVNYQLAELIGRITGKPVIPTYSFAIFYPPGGNMDAHTDRMQNELSMSLNLACTPAGTFPALRAGLDKSDLREIYLQPNSALFYRGAEVTHARCPVPAGHQVDQVVFGFRTVSQRHCYCI